MDDNAGHEPEPITPELLADLQAGLLDDATAAALRQRVRTDSAAAGMLSALDRVRRDLADLGADQGTAPDVPAEVTARVGAALQAAPRRIGRAASQLIQSDTPHGGSGWRWCQVSGPRLWVPSSAE